VNKKTSYLAAIVFIAVLSVSIVNANNALCHSVTADVTTMPRLAYPVNPEVTITGDYLEFKWWRAAGGVRGYEFALYEGGGPFGDAIVKKTLPFNASSIQVEAKLFENNKVYTWTLRQVSDSGQKSDQSFNTFRVFKQ